MLEQVQDEVEQHEISEHRAGTDDDADQDPSRPLQRALVRPQKQRRARRDSPFVLESLLHLEETAQALLGPNLSPQVLRKGRHGLFPPARNSLVRRLGQHHGSPDIGQVFEEEGVQDAGDEPENA